MDISSLKNRAVFVSFLLLLFVSNAGFAQNTDSSKIEKIEKIFERFAPESPGCVCAVNKGGETVFQKGYGMANLELDVPLSPDSVFYIASTSKQFTAASIAMLSLSGKVSLDSSIREHIPEMPDYAENITVKNLLHHTSGIRDYFCLFILKGWTEKEYFNNAMAVDLITRQKGVLFPPGERYAYSNSNYVLLAEIVKRTSRKTLNEYSRENIFKPLGMNNTHFDDNYEAIVKNRASSYGYNNGKYFRYLKAFDGVGDGNLLTTVNDLFKWGQNFKDHKLGGKEFTDLLLTRGKLNNGKELDYAFGLMPGTYRRLDIISHRGGGLNGFKTDFIRFPEQDFSVAVLCNVEVANPTLIALQVSDIFLDDIMTPKESPMAKPAIERKEIDADSSILDDYVGEYSIVGTTMFITLDGKQLTTQITGQPKDEIFPESENKFFLKGADVQWEFKRNENGEVTAAILYQGGQEIEAPKKKPTVPLAPEKLNEYTGVFYSLELDIEYTVSLKDKNLVIKYAYIDDVVLKSSDPDKFTGGTSWLGTSKLEYIRDKDNKITGFNLSAMDIQNIGFTKKGIGGCN